MRTSLTHPLRIDTVVLPSGGRIGMTLCPGKQQADAATGPWARDLETDLKAICAWGAQALVTLVESHELSALGVPDLGELSLACGLEWHHLPIPDVSVPQASFEAAWIGAAPSLHRLLDAGHGVVVHCKGGLGRTGLVACRLLIERGVSPRRALADVRQLRPGAVETDAQADYLFRRAFHPWSGAIQ